MPAPADDLMAMQIREQALRLWRRFSFKDKEDCKILNESRVSDPKVYKKGGRLLKTQDLLAGWRPNIAVAANFSDSRQDTPVLAVTTPVHLKTRNVSSALHPSCPPSAPARVESARSLPNVATDADGLQSILHPPQLLIRADRLGRTTISAFFPQMTHATSTTPKTQPCYVPFAPRPGLDRNC